MSNTNAEISCFEKFPDESRDQIAARQLFYQELLNSITHGIGAGLAIAAVPLLAVRAVYFAPEEIRLPCLVGFVIFGISLVVLYLSSTLYHAIQPGKLKQLLCVFDHSAIYILIAGTYTPLCLSALYGWIGWSLFAAIWFLAILGIIMYVLFRDRYRWFSLGLYLFMGWLVVFALRPVLEAMPPLTIYLLVIGGISYTVGCIFFVMNNVWWAHPVWHLFVLGGSITQFLAVYWVIQ